MTNLFFNLPENIISNIYSYDSTFRDKYNISMLEMEFLMDEPEPEDEYEYGEYYCCDYCSGRDYYYLFQQEGDRVRRFFKQEFIKKKRDIIQMKREKLIKKEINRLENIELNILELLRREKNNILDIIKCNKNRIKNNKKKNKLNKNRMIT